MNRRTLLGGLAGAATLGTAAFVLTRGASGERIDPIEYELVWSPTDAETTELPDPGRVTLLEFFATDCVPCQNMMPDLRRVYDDLDSSAVQLVSLSIDAIGGTIEHDTLVDWWETYDGRWPMASESDHDLHFMREFDVGATPWTVVLDRDNRVVTDSMGYHDHGELMGMIDDAR